MAWIKLNSTTPAPPSRTRNVHFRQEAGHTGTQSDPIPTSAYFEILAGGVNVQTGTTYELVSGDDGQLLILDNADPVAVTLPDPATLPEDFWLLVKNLGAGLATLTPTDSTIDGEASLDLAQGAWMAIFREGAAYISLQPGGGGDAGTIGGIPVDDATPPTDGQIIQYSEATGKWEFVTDRPVKIVSAVPGKPAAGQLVLIYTATETTIFPGNFTSPNAKGSLANNPTATATYTIYKNGSPVGTVVISTGGVFTFGTTSGATITFNAGDRMIGVAPGSQDATLSDVGFTLVGTRAATVSGAFTQQIFVFRGAYAGGTGYNANDVVSYQGGLYLCIAPTTGNVPTNVTYWTVMLGYTWTFRGAYAGGTAYVPNDVVTSGGSTYLCTAATTGNTPPNGTYWAKIAAAGSVSETQVQQESLTYSADSGAADAYAVTLSPAPTIVAGSAIQFKAAHANTGASTLAVNGAGPVAIKKSGGTALASGDIVAGQIVLVVFDGTYWETVGGGGGGDLTAKYILGAADAALPNALVWPSLYYGPDAPPISPGSLDDEFDGASLDTGRWAWVNQGTSSAAIVKGTLVVMPQNAAADSVRALVQSVPGTPWTVEAKIRLVDLLTPSASARHVGLCVTDGTKLVTITVCEDDAAPPNIYLYVLQWNTVTSWHATTVATKVGSVMTNGHWSSDLSVLRHFRIQDDGTNLKLSYSPDGINWNQVRSELRGSWLTTGPTKVGLALACNNAAGLYVGCYEWFRRTQ